jgi:hypothetical protein
VGIVGLLSCLLAGRFDSFLPCPEERSGTRGRSKKEQEEKTGLFFLIKKGEKKLK